MESIQCAVTEPVPKPGCSIGGLRRQPRPPGPPLPPLPPGQSHLRSRQRRSPALPMEPFGAGWAVSATMAGLRRLPADAPSRTPTRAAGGRGPIPARRDQRPDAPRETDEALPEAHPPSGKAAARVCRAIRQGSGMVRLEAAVQPGSRTRKPADHHAEKRNSSWGTTGKKDAGLIWLPSHPGCNPSVSTAACFSGEGTGNWHLATGN